MLLEGHRGVFVFGALQLVGDIRCMQITVVESKCLFLKEKCG